VNLAQVPAHLFKPSGKWAYEVFLDYRGILDADGKSLDGKFIGPAQAALRALRQATERGTSGVTIKEPDYYYLVVIDPPNGFPVMIVSKEGRDDS
jgi:hypothetical protein